MKKQNIMSQIQGQGKTPKKPKWSAYRQPFRKRIQNNDSEGDPEYWENNGEDAKIPKTYKS